MITFYDPQAGKTAVTEGVVKGEIMHEPRGNSGFGYDPVFYVPEAGKTLAEMTLEEKNKVSHRARAMQKMRDVLKKQLGKVKV